MDEQTIILFLFLLSIGLLFLSIFAFSKLGHIHKRLKDIEEILADVQIGNENRKILIKPCDVMAHWFISLMRLSTIMKISYFL